MRQRMPWVKWSPADFLNGVVGLDPFSIAAYTVILNLIYDNGGPIRADDAMMRKIARRISMRFDHFERAISVLTKEGKLIVADGVMSNARAELELGSRASKVAKLVSNFNGGDAVDRKNGHDINGATAQMGDLKVEKTVTDKNKNKTRGRVEPPSPKAKQLKATRIDPRRQISDSNTVFARSRGLRQKEVDFEWMKFTRHYAALPDNRPQSKSIDWDAVWESWVLRKAHELNREPLVEDQSNGQNDPAHWPRDVWARQIELWRKGVGWPDQFGPEPGQPGCLAPSDLVSLS